jgi:hypothetical protein
MSLKIQHLQFLDIKSDLARKYECDKFINKFNVIIHSQIFPSLRPNRVKTQCKY